MHVIVGLGNPGMKYQHTRHNLGFDVIDVLANRYHIPVKQREAESLCGQGKMGRHTVLLVKPQTYMNASGRAVAPLVQRYWREGELLVVIHDDIDLPPGRVKVKRQGGDAGHLGIRSTIACLGHGTFVRVRLGVGRPTHRDEVVPYVLSRFLPEEEEVRCGMLEQAAQCVETLLETAGRP